MSQPPQPPYSGPPYPEQPGSGQPWQGGQQPPYPGQPVDPYQPNQPYSGQPYSDPQPYSGQPYQGQPNPDVPPSVQPGFPPPPQQQYGQQQPPPPGYGQQPPPFGGQQAGGFGPPPPKPKSKALPITLVAIAVILVLCIGGGTVLYLAGNNTDEPDPSPTATATATSPRTTEPTTAPTTEPPAATITVVEPRTLGGRPKLTDPQFADIAEELQKSLADVPRARNSVGALYGDPLDQDIVVIAAVEATVTDPARELDGTFLGAGVGGLQVTGIKEVEPGPLGGEAKCGKAETGGIDLVMCGWADEGSLGWVIWYFKSVSDVEDEFADLRGQIEKKS